MRKICSDNRAQLTPPSFLLGHAMPWNNGPGAGWLAPGPPPPLRPVSDAQLSYREEVATQRECGVKFY
jgi:hypothetical protein